jgi:hypothetical protein
VPPYRLVVRGEQLDELLKGPDGAIVRAGSVLGDRIIQVARTKITRRFTGPIAPGAGGATLGGTLVKRWGVGANGPELSIIAMAPYAMWVHEGNESNRGDGRIWPVRAKALRFVVPGGGFIFRKWVRVSKPNPFLRQALEEVVPSE